MKYIAVVIALFVASVQCQPGRPPRPPPNSPPRPPAVPQPSASVAVAVAQSAPPQASASSGARPAAAAQPAPTRPEGCSPGCGPTEICAKLGDSYCRQGQVCSVCIKMESIRFPASALAGMFSRPNPAAATPQVVAPQPQPQLPVVPAQPVGGMNSFTYNLPSTPPPFNDPFADLFGFGSQPQPQPQPQQPVSSYQNNFDFNSPTTYNNRNSTSSFSTNSFMPLLFFEGLGFGGLGF